MRKYCDNYRGLGLPGCSGVLHCTGVQRGEEEDDTAVLLFTIRSIKLHRGKDQTSGRIFLKENISMTQAMVTTMRELMLSSISIF